MSRCNRRSPFPLFVTLLALIFLYAPLIVVGVASFNKSKYGGKWEGFSMVWYEKLFHSDRVWEALGNTLFIALIATVISTVLGTLAALALYRMKNKIYKGVYSALVYTPLVVPDILMGMSLLLLFVLTIKTFTAFTGITIALGMTTIIIAHVTFWSYVTMVVPFVLIIKTFGTWFTAPTGITIELGMTTIIIAHVTFCMSYVTMVVLGRLQEFDKSLIEAAEDLGASGLYTFFHVTLPVIMPGVIAGALFAFTLSIDDFVITFFVKGAGDTTLPIFIQSSIKHGRELPMLNALSVIFLILTFILVFVTQILLTNKPKEKK